MKEKRISIASVIMDFFEANQGRIIETREVYDEVSRKYPLTVRQLEESYDRPRYQHVVRSALQKLCSRKEISRVSAGHYKFGGHFNTRARKR